MALFGKKESGMGELPPAGMPPPSQGMDPNQAQGNNYYPDPNQQQNPNMGMPPPGMDQGMGGGYEDQGYEQEPQDDGVERFEEIAEAIINEKWNELIKDINKVIEWKERVDTQVKRMEQEITNLKERFEGLHRGVLGKIGNYDENLTNVGSEIKAMQMAFQKILPTFTENVNKLDRIAKGMPIKLK